MKSRIYFGHGGVRWRRSLDPPMLVDLKVSMETQTQFQQAYRIQDLQAGGGEGYPSLLCLLSNRLWHALPIKYSD